MTSAAFTRWRLAGMAWILVVMRNVSFLSKHVFLLLIVFIELAIPYPSVAQNLKDPIEYVMKKGQEIFREKQSRIRKKPPEKQQAIKPGTPGYRDVEEALELLDLMGYKKVSAFYRDWITKGKLWLDPNIGSETAGLTTFIPAYIYLNPSFALPSSWASIDPCEDSARLLDLASTLYHEYLHYKLGLGRHLLSPRGGITLNINYTAVHAWVHHQQFNFLKKWIEKALTKDPGIPCCLLKALLNKMSEGYNNVLDYYPYYIYRNRMKTVLEKLEGLSVRYCTSERSDKTLIRVEQMETDYSPRFDYSLEEATVKTYYWVRVIGHYLCEGKKFPISAAVLKKYMKTRIDVAEGEEVEFPPPEEIQYEGKKLVLDYIIHDGRIVTHFRRPYRFKVTRNTTIILVYRCKSEVIKKTIQRVKYLRKDIEKEISDLTRERELLRRADVQCAQECPKLEQQLKALQQQLNQAQQALQKLQADLSTETRKEAAIQKQIDDLNKQLQRWKAATRETRRRTFEEFQRQVKPLVEEQKRIRAEALRDGHIDFSEGTELLRIGKKIDEMSAKFWGNTYELEKRYRKEMPKLRQQLAAQKQKIADLKRKIVNHQRLTKNLQQQIERLKQRIEQCKQRWKAIRQRLQQTEEERKKKQEALKKNDEELKKFQKELKVAVTLPLSPERKIALRQGLEALERRLTERSSTLATQIASLEAQMEIQTQLFSTQMEQLASIEQQYDDRLFQRDQLQFVLKRWEGSTPEERREALLSQIETLDRQLQWFQEQRRQFLESYLASSEQVERTERPEGMERLLVTQTAWAQIIATWDSLKQDWLRERAFLEEELALSRNLDAQKVRLEAVEGELAQLAQQRDSLQQEIETVQVELNALDEQLELTLMEHLIVSDRLSDTRLALDYAKADIFPLDLLPLEEEVEEVKREEMETPKRGFRRGGFLALEARTLAFDGQRGWLLGGQIGVHAHPTLRLGVGAYALVTDLESRFSRLEQLPPEVSLYLNLGYVGLTLEYTLLTRSPILLSLHSLVGIGRVGYHRGPQFRLDFSEGDTFWVVEPGARVSMRLVGPLALGFSGNYRFVLDAAFADIRAETLSGLSAGVMLSLNP